MGKRGQGYGLKDAGIPEWAGDHRSTRPSRYLVFLFWLPLFHIPLNRFPNGHVGLLDAVKRDSSFVIGPCRCLWGADADNVKVKNGVDRGTPREKGGWRSLTCHLFVVNDGADFYEHTDRRQVHQC